MAAVHAPDDAQPNARRPCLVYRALLLSAPHRKLDAPAWCLNVRWGEPALGLPDPRCALPTAVAISGIKKPALGRLLVADFHNSISRILDCFALPVKSRADSIQRFVQNGQITFGAALIIGAD